MVGFDGGFNDRQNLERVKANGADKGDQLDDVDPSLAALDARHEGLTAPEHDRQVSLTEARLDSGIDQCLTKGRLSGASDCFRHALHVFCDVASG